MKTCGLVLCLTAGLACTSTLQASHIRETLTLSAGWNAVLIESTPEENDCARFFGDLPVVSVGAYVSDAYSNTRQYRSDGTVIGQKPVSFQTWHAEDEVAGVSDLVSLVGGSVYLIYATNACTKTFDGVPVSPAMSWREASEDGTGIMNLAAPSIPAGALVSLSDYFAEGPVGMTGKAWQIGGTGSAPSYLSLAFMGKKAKLVAGRGYMLTSEHTADWPGVVGLVAEGGGVEFGETATVAAAMVANHGTATHVFRVTVDASSLTSETFPPLSRQLDKTDIRVEAGWTNVTAGASWDIELAAGESRQIKFGIDRDALSSEKTYGAVLRVNDLGSSGMQVRLPMTVCIGASEDYNAAYPSGLWLGKFVLTGVAEGTNRVTMAAAGTMKPTVIVHVDGKAQPEVSLLQQVSVARNPTGDVTKIFRTLAGAKRESDAPRRYSSLIVDPAVSPVKGEGAGFGENLTFTYAIAPDSDCNPFRHAWHPDHDGLNADYTGKSATETWAITNTITFAWKDDLGRPIYEKTPDGESMGYVRWRIDGLKTQPVFIDGAFALERVLNNSKLED